MDHLQSRWVIFGAALVFFTDVLHADTDTDPNPNTPAPSAPEQDRVLIPAGPFLRGADHGGEPDERPMRTVTLPRYAIDRFEVTEGDYAACVARGPCRPAKRYGSARPEPTLPVVGVSWFEAKTYCAWAGGRLPTEAEWEKSARGEGEDSRRYPWGNEDPDDTRATFASHHAGPTPVGSKPLGASPFGLHDMAGNVWEWVSDVYGPTYYEDGPVEAPQGPTCDEAERVMARLRALGRTGFTGSNPIPTECERVLRGGGWNYPGPGLRVTNRVHHPPNFHIRFSGFRCASDVP